MWPFDKKTRKDCESHELPRSRQELLLGDTNKTWTLLDYTIHPTLHLLYNRIQADLQQIFERGKLDSENGSLFDDKIDCSTQIALHDLNSQYALRPEGIEKMVSWRERDLTELWCREERHTQRISEAHDELKRLEKRRERINKKEENHD